jgi:hypothetical protein
MKTHRIVLLSFALLGSLGTLGAQTFKAGTTTTGAPGTAAALSIKKTGKTVKFNFTIPQGPQGIQGASPFTLSGSNAIYNNGNLGIGTSAPDAVVTIDGNNQISATDGVAMFSIYETKRVSPNQQHLAFDSDDIMSYDGNSPTTLYLGYYGGGVSLAGGAGNVFVGTNNNPNAAIRVTGTVQMGLDGQFYAPAAEENLRMFRGFVQSNGTKTRGTAYTVTRNGTGSYQVTYDTAFTAVPSVTVTSGTFNTAFYTFNPTVSGVAIVGYRSDTGAAKDGDFDFIVLGPR